MSYTVALKTVLGDITPEAEPVYVWLKSSGCVFVCLHMSTRMLLPISKALLHVPVLTRRSCEQ